MVTDGICAYKISEYGQTLKWTEKGRKWIIDRLVESKKHSDDKWKQIEARRKAFYDI